MAVEHARLPGYLASIAMNPSEGATHRFSLSTCGLEMRRQITANATTFTTKERFLLA